MAKARKRKAWRIGGILVLACACAIVACGATWRFAAPVGSQTPGESAFEPADEAQGALPLSQAGECVANEVLVRLPEGVSASELAASLADVDCVNAADATAGDEALGWVTLSVPEGHDVSEALSELGKTGLALEAQPNFVYHLLESNASSLEPKATATSLLAASAAQTAQVLTNDELAFSNDWWMEAIGLPDAWARQKSAKSVTVAVMDTGCSTGHADLRANINLAKSYNALTGKVGASAVEDGDGHGTHVAGIISAIPDNGIGVAGVSANARVLPIKVIEAETSSTSVLLRAYEYVMKLKKADSSLRIVNMSLGGSGGYDPALLRAIDKAYYDYDILSVFAAGNDDERRPYYCFPCDYAEVGLGVINVGKTAATTLRGREDSSSNYNVKAEKTKDIAAPGIDVLSTFPATLNDVNALNSIGYPGYCYYSGTSMATPVVSGVAALVAAANPRLSASELKSVICSTAADIQRQDGSGVGFDAYTGYGLVRADLAVARAKTAYLKGRDGVAVGSSIKLSAPGSGAWTWSSGSKGVAVVDAAGKVTGNSAGEVVITATNASTRQKASKTIVVYKASISGASQLTVGKSASFAFKANPVTLGAWSSSKPQVAVVNPVTGVVTAKKAGTTVISAGLTAAPNVKVSKTVKVVKKVNPLTVKTKVKSVKRSKVRVRAQRVSGAIVISKKGKGALTYAKVVKGSSARLSVNKKTGAITVKRGTARGTYKIKVKVRAAGNSVYAARTRTVTAKIKVV